MAGHVGDVVTARNLCTDPDPGVRATALGALHRAGGLAAVDVAAAIADVEPGVRRRAIEVIAALGADPDRCAGGVSLLPLLHDPDPTVVEAAAWACGERLPPEPGTVGQLAELAGSHDDGLVREAAVAALGAIGDPAGRAAVLAATSDRATVRRRAVIALAAFDGPEVDAALARARTDRDWQVRQAAEDLTHGGSAPVDPHTHRTHGGYAPVDPHTHHTHRGTAPVDPPTPHKHRGAAPTSQRLGVVAGQLAKQLVESGFGVLQLRRVRAADVIQGRCQRSDCVPVDNAQRKAEKTRHQLRPRQLVNRRTAPEAHKPRFHVLTIALRASRRPRDRGRVQPAR